MPASRRKRRETLAKPSVVLNRKTWLIRPYSEFVGRLPVLATLDELDTDALVRILKEPKNAYTKQYEKLFEMEGSEIDFREDAHVAVAKKAMERKTEHAV